MRKDRDSGKVFARGMQLRIQAGAGAFLGSPAQHLGYRGMTEMSALNSSPAALSPLLPVPGDREACLLLTQDLSRDIGSSSSACRLWKSGPGGHHDTQHLQAPRGHHRSWTLTVQG